MGKVAKDKWDKVIEHLTHSDSDLEKVLSLLKGYLFGINTKGLNVKFFQ